MTTTTFNRTPLSFGERIEPPPADVVKTTLGLWNASLDDALKYGGELTRAAIAAMPIRGDRKHVTVDTKVHMLLPGFSPAIPGWHNDGTPRCPSGSSNGELGPMVDEQESAKRSKRYHLLVTGTGCLTRFLADECVPIEYAAPAHLYRQMSEAVEAMPGKLVLDAPSCRAVTFDWWQIHTGVVATEAEWRFLIRVCESDCDPPERDLRRVIRVQAQVYAQAHFGW